MNRRNKLVSLLLSVVLACGLVPQLAFAEVGKETAAPQKVTVSYHLQDATSTYLVNESDVEVASDEAESMGFTDQVTDGVSALDVLVKAHVDAFGITKDDAADYLAVSDAGYVTKLFGQETSANGFMLNGAYPNDGTESNWGGYTGTTVTTQAVASGDVLDFFIYEDQSSWGDQAAWFCKDGVAVDSITVRPGSQTNLVLKGVAFMSGYLYKDAEAMRAAGQPIAAAQLASVDGENSTWADVDSAITSDAGSVTFVAPSEEGTYYYTAHSAGGTAVIPPVLKVVVSSEAPAPVPAAELTALSVASFDSFPNALELAPAFDADVTEYRVPAVKWSSNSWERMFRVKASAPEGAVISASLNGGAAKAVASGDSSWTLFNGSDLLVKGVNTLAVTVAASDAVDAETKTYTVTVPVGPMLSFSIDPADATVSVTDPDGNSVSATAPLLFSVEQGKTYTYTVSKAGYVTKRATVEASADTTSVPVTLEKAPAGSLVDFDSAWPSFRGSDDNMAIVDAKTPRTADEAKLLWDTKLTSGWDRVSNTLIVGDNLYALAGKEIKKIDKATGNVIATGALASDNSWYDGRLAYGDGMLFATVDKGRVQALNADTLESLWVSEELGGSTTTPLSYKDGYVYTGISQGSSSANAVTYLCLSATDEDPSATDEVKYPTWIYRAEGTGCYWAGAYLSGDVIVFGSDAGVLTSCNAKTGKVISTFQADGQIRSSIAYAEGNLYFSTTAGKVYSVPMGADGALDDGSAKSGQVDGMTKSTSTPVVFNGRLYIGGGSSSFSSGVVAVMDAATMSTVYSANVQGYVQSSALLSTAYAADGGKVYAYFTYNYNPGGILVLEDAAGQTEAKVSNLFVPEGSLAQYCLCSPICDSDGTLYYNNDSGVLMAIGRTSCSITYHLDGGTNAETNPSSYIPGTEVALAAPTKSGYTFAGWYLDEGLTQKVDAIGAAQMGDVELWAKWEKDPAPVFTDVDYNSWYAPGVDFVAGRGLMRGYEGTTIFGVGNALTRGELATILWRNACPDEAASYDPAAAKDTTGIAGSADGMFYTAAANWAVEKGVITGIERPGGSLDFAADEPVTFEQLVTVLGRLGAAPGELEAAGSDLSAFVDGADASEWSAPYLKWAADKGLIEGYDEPAGKRLAPGENASRERAATVLMRAFDKGILK